MELQPSWRERWRTWARRHPWRWAAVAAAVLFFIGVVGSLFTNEPIHWPRTITLSLLLGSASGLLAKSQQ